MTSIKPVTRCEKMLFLREYIMRLLNSYHVDHLLPR